MNEFQAQTTTECLSTWCGRTVDHTESHNDIRVERSASRVEAAAWVYGDEIGDCSSYDAMLGALAAADAHDAAHGIHRVSLGGETVERAAKVIDPKAWQDSWIEFYPEGCKHAREAARTKARAVLAAAVEAGQ